LSEGSGAEAARRAQGIVLMSLSMFLLPAVDGFAKHLSSLYSPLMIGWVSFCFSSAFMLPMAIRQHGRQIFPPSHLRWHLLRLAFLLMAGTLYCLAVSRVQLADAISVYFINPVVAAVLSVLFLGERMTAAKLVSLVLGIVGAMVILRPGSGGTDIGLLYALGSGVAFACFMVTTRKIAGGASPWQTVTFQYLVGLVLLAPQTFLHWTTPRLEHLWIFAAMAAFSVVCHMLSILAFRRAEASTLAPLTYIELLGSVVIGYLFFGDLPGGLVIVGAALIVAAGAILLPRRASPAPDRPAA
jgi:drug/metabolite transporter (DMT)-like permease